MSCCGLSRPPEHAELKMLRTTHGSPVIMAARFDEREGVAQRLRKTCGIVADHRQTAAPFGAIKRKGADDGMSSGRNGSQQPLHIGGPICGFGSERKDSAVGTGIVASD